MSKEEVIMTKMTVHEALCEIKVADKRIEKAIQECAFCEANKEISPKINGITVAEFENDVKAKYQKINDLIRRNENIKKALSLSNAKTVISVNGKEMTMAEAIYMMQYGIKHKEQQLMAMNRALTRAQQKIESENGNRLEERLDKFIQATYGSKEKVSAEELEEEDIHVLVQQQKRRRKEQDERTAVTAERAFPFRGPGRQDRKLPFRSEKPQGRGRDRFRTDIEQREVLDCRQISKPHHAEHGALPKELHHGIDARIALARKPPVKIRGPKENLQQVRLQHEPARKIHREVHARADGRQKQQHNPARVTHGHEELAVHLLVVGMLDERKRRKPEIQNEVQVRHERERKDHLAPRRRPETQNRDARHHEAHELAEALGGTVHARIHKERIHAHRLPRSFR